MGQRVFKVGDKVTNVKTVGSVDIGEASGVITDIYNADHYDYPIQVRLDKHGRIGSFSHDELGHLKHYIVKEIIDDL